MVDSVCFLSLSLAKDFVPSVAWWDYYRLVRNAIRVINATCVLCCCYGFVLVDYIIFWDNFLLHWCIHTVSEVANKLTLTMWVDVLMIWNSRNHLQWLYTIALTILCSKSRFFLFSDWDSQSSKAFVSYQFYFNHDIVLLRAFLGRSRPFNGLFSNSVSSNSTLHIKGCFLYVILYCCDQLGLLWLYRGHVNIHKSASYCWWKPTPLSICIINCSLQL